VSSSFYSDNKWKQFALNLFNGWGYNFYRVANQLRTDDLLVRSKAAELLAEARRDVVEAELAYRREHLPPPTRDKPFPDPEATRQAKRIQAVADELSAVAGLIASAPAPENDRMWERHRDETGTLQRLGEIDLRVVELAAAVRESTREGGMQWVMNHLDDMQQAAHEIRDVLKQREGVLRIPS